LDGIDLNAIPAELESLVEAEWLRKKQAEYGKNIISWMAPGKETSAIAPAINLYLRNLFSGYPEIAESYKVATEADKADQMTKMYETTFNEEDTEVNRMLDELKKRQQQLNTKKANK